MNPSYDLTKVKTDSSGNVLTGTAAINPNYLSKDGYASALNFATNNPSVPNQSPTVMTDANIRETTIPSIMKKSDQLGTSNPPVVGSMAYDLANGLAPGTSSQPGYKSTNTTGDTSTGGSIEDIFNTQYNTADQSPNTLSPEQQDLFDLQSKMLDTDSANAIAAIRAKYDVRNRLLVEGQASQTKGMSNALQLGGSDRYAPISSSGIMSAKERYDMQTLSDLQTEEDGLIADVNKAKTQGQFQILQGKLDALEKKRQEKIDLAGKISQSLADQNKALMERQQTLDDNYIKDTQSVTLDLAKNNAPLDLKNKVAELIKNKASYADIVNTAGDYLQTGTGIIGEYQFYKRQAESKGLVPVDFNTYQNEDANRKIAIQKAGIGNTGIDAATLTKVQAVAGQFDNEQSVKNYQTVAEGKAFLDSISNDTKNPADQQGIIYAFAKIMDPNSVVREGEYNTVQKYAQSWASTFGFDAKRIFSNSPFLTSQAIANMKATIDSKVQASEKSYKNIYDEYGRRINKMTGKDDGTDYITDYSKGYGNTGDGLIQNEQEAENTVIQYGKDHPEVQSGILDLLKETNPKTNKFYTNSEIMQIYNIPQVKGFTDVMKKLNPFSTDLKEETPMPTITIPPTSKLSFANNNPGNLKFAGQDGAVSGEKGFAKFTTPEAGFQALKNQIKLDASRGHTLASFISKFAPAFENDTKLYIKQLASRLGIKPDTKIQDVDLDKLAQEVAIKESSTKFS